MPAKLPKFDKEVLASLNVVLAPFGFKHAKSLYFTRPKKAWLDVIFLDLEHATKRAFCAVHGVHVPSIQEKLRALGDSGMPSPLLSRYLGLTESGGIQKWYRFADEEALVKAVDAMAADFQTIGLPWLDSFREMSDIVNYFREHEIGPLPDGTFRRPDALSWAIYGWLLKERGGNEQGNQWLIKAQKELAKPVYCKGGRFSAEPEKGARLVPKLPQEVALAQILHDELQEMPKGV